MKLLPTILLLALGAASALAQAPSVPSYLSYQGRVTDSSGVLMGNTAPVNRTVQFKLYTTSTGGTAIWAETQVATISTGEFSVLIGNGAGISGLTGPAAPAVTPYKTLADVLNSTASLTLYLGITVDDGNASTVDAEVSPRQQLVAGAYAFRAKVAESVATSAITASMIGTSEVGTNAIQASAVTNVKIADSAITSAKIAASNVMASNLASGAVTSDKIDASTVGLWSVSSSGIYRGGNVGIGTNAPGFPLNFADVLGDKISLYGNSGFHFGFGIQPSLFQIYTSVNSSDVAFGYGTSFNFTETMRVKGTGLVGIGTATPAFPLSFANTLGDKIALWGQGGNHYGLGIQGALLQIHCDSAGADIAFGYGSSASFSEVMRIKGSGRVGINNSNPQAPLHVSGYVYDHFYLEYYVDTARASDAPNQFRTDLPHSIISDQRIRCAALDVASDARIKKVLNLSSNKADLATLLRIQITDYKYIDEPTLGKKPQKKVIAQQIEQVYPQAVTQSTSAVPDIYKPAAIKNGWVQLKTDLKQGQRVRIMTPDKEDIYEVLQVIEGQFRIDLDTDADKAFVYGRQVKDFRSVDYDAISMLNVSATQALYQQQETDRKNAAALAQKVAEMESSAGRREAQISTMEVRIAALEKLLNATK